MAPFFHFDILRNLNKTDLEFLGEKSSSFKVFRAHEICQKKENYLDHPTENSGESAYSQLPIIQLMHWTPNVCKTLQEEKGEALAIIEFQNWEKQDKKPDRTQQTHMKY